MTSPPQPQDPQPTPLDYAHPRGRNRYPWLTFIITTVLVTIVHLCAFLVIAFLAYASRSSGPADTIAHLLAYPLLQLAWLLNPGESAGWILVPLNSLCWGIALGGLAAVIHRRRRDAA